MFSRNSFFSVRIARSRRRRATDCVFKFTSHRVKRLGRSQSFSFSLACRSRYQRDIKRCANDVTTTAPKRDSPLFLMPIVNLTAVSSCVLEAYINMSRIPDINKHDIFVIVKHYIAIIILARFSWTIFVFGKVFMKRVKIEFLRRAQFFDIEINKSPMSQHSVAMNSMCSLSLARQQNSETCWVQLLLKRYHISHPIFPSHFSILRRA